LLEEKITDWITKISKEGDLPSNCKAIYIGLFENETGYMIHFMGSVEFDPEDDDWACEDSEDYFPKNRYLESGIPSSENWESFLNEVNTVVKNLKSNKNLVLSQVKNLAIGFDSGDLIHI